MASQSQMRAGLWLCTKFVILAPVCLVLWVAVLPAYTVAVSQTSSFVLRHAFGQPIVKTLVWIEGEDKGPAAPSTETAGPANRFFLYLVRNTHTTLSLIKEDGNYTRMVNVGDLLTNIAPFVALVLATSGLGILRRIRILGIGVAIIFTTHVFTVIFRFAAGKTALPTAVGLISITLPFLLWIVLAYWDKLIGYVAESTRDALPPSTPK